MKANATTSAGTITKVEFYRGQNNLATLIATDTTAPYDFQWTQVPAGNYELYARVTDSSGAIKDSQIVAITVNAAQSTVRLQGEVKNPAGGTMSGVTLVLSGTANGAWYVILSGSGSYRIMPWGLASDKPVPGDYDRDGKTDFAVFRESEGNWYIYQGSLDSYIVRHFGMTGDIPIPTALNR